MIVRAEAHPNNKMIGVELTEADVWPDGTDLGIQEKWKAMTDKADLLLVEYMYRRGDVSKEYATGRITEIQNR